MSVDLIQVVENLHGTSPEKATAFADALAEIDDQTLDEAVPFASPMVLRMLVTAAAEAIPTDAAAFDETLEQISAFVLSLRSDPVTADV